MSSKTVAGGAEIILALALAGWVRVRGEGRSHFPGICGIKVFVWCWDINKTAVLRAPDRTIREFQTFVSLWFQPMYYSDSNHPILLLWSLWFGDQKGWGPWYLFLFSWGSPLMWGCLGTLHIWSIVPAPSPHPLLLLLFNCVWVHARTCMNKNSDWNMVFAWNFSGEQGWLPVWACQGLSTREKKA